MTLVNSVFLGKYYLMSPLVFSFVPLYQGLIGSAKYTFTPVSSVKILCSAISSPLSYVIDNRMNGSISCKTSEKASLTDFSSFFPGMGTRITYQVVLPTNVPRALL